MNPRDKLELFFKLDLKIKNTINKCTPVYSSIYDQAYLSDYTELLFKSFKDIISDLSTIIDLYFSNFKDFFGNYFNEIYEELLACGYDGDKIAKFYQTRISNMSEVFLDKLKNEIKGYLIVKDYSSPMKEIKSINEVLHFFHHDIINDNYILESVPVEKSMVTKIGEPIEVRGDNSIFAEQVALAISNTEAGYTDIINLDNVMIIMLRDMGHATVIEVDKSEEKLFIKYFIPKQVSMSKADNLKGIRACDNPDQIYRTGEFEASEEDFIYMIEEFVNMIPTDADYDFTR